MAKGKGLEWVNWLGGYGCWEEEWTYVGFAGENRFELAAPAAHDGGVKLNDLLLHVVCPEVRC